MSVPAAQVVVRSFPSNGCASSSFMLLRCFVVVGAFRRVVFFFSLVRVRVCYVTERTSTRTDSSLRFGVTLRYGVVYTLLTSIYCVDGFCRSWSGFVAFADKK